MRRALKNVIKQGIISTLDKQNYAMEVTIMNVTKQTLIGEVIDCDVNAARFFFEIGMHCVG